VRNRHPKVSAGGLRVIQESIYREKVFRARAMTPEQRLVCGLELSRESLSRLEGAMW